MKAVNVTAPGGGPCSGPRKSRPNHRRRDGRGAGKKSSAAAGAASSSNTKGPSKPRDPFWHESLNDSVRGMLEEKGIRLGTGTIDVSVGEARVKLGTNGYSSVAYAGGMCMLGEGSFTCDVDGNATFTWEHCIAFDKANGVWSAALADTSLLPSSFGLADGTYVFRFVFACILVNRLSSVLLIPHIIRSLYINTILLHRNHHTQHTTHSQCTPGPT